jgi:hypothetical protein
MSDATADALGDGLLDSTADALGEGEDAMVADDNSELGSDDGALLTDETTLDDGLIGTEDTPIELSVNELGSALDGLDASDDGAMLATLDGKLDSVSDDGSELARDETPDDKLDMPELIRLGAKLDDATALGGLDTPDDSELIAAMLLTALDVVTLDGADDALDGELTALLIALEAVKLDGCRLDMRLDG